jgi:hypothetical protein
LKIPKGGNQNLYEEEQTTQWPKEKVQKDKQWSTKHAYKTKERVTRTPLKTGDELRWRITKTLMSPFWINSFHNKCVMKTWMIGNSKLMKWKTIKIQHCQNSSKMFSVYTWLITRFVTRLIWWVPLVEQKLFTLFICKI